MQAILAQLGHHSAAHPEKTAFEDDTCAMTYREVARAIAVVGARVAAQRVAVMMDNSVAWAVVDLAIAACGAVSIPVPAFFSAAQVEHLLTDAAPDLLITDRPGQGIGPTHVLRHETMVVGRTDVLLYSLQPASRRVLASDTGKITYTSGTTGQPRGVCISRNAIDEVTAALADAACASDEDRSLTVLPLSTLLANIGGIYVPILRGATAVLPSLAQCGFTGSSAVDPRTFVGAFHRFSPTATILVPQLLKLAVEATQAGARFGPGLRFVAVGGAPCSEPLIDRARALGIPVYEGYGLSEAASVVSMNRPGSERAGSVGMPLPHARVRIADDGEIVVAGTSSAVISAAIRPPCRRMATGDTGWLDADGFLYVSGRKKTAFATAFGTQRVAGMGGKRAVRRRGLSQAAVFGEGRAFNVAVWSRPCRGASAEHDPRRCRCGQCAPARLRTRARLVSAAPPSPWRNGLARPGGALNRHAIAEHYATAMETLYASRSTPMSTHERLVLRNRGKSPGVSLDPDHPARPARRGKRARNTSRFCSQAYHHVRQTVPLMMGMGYHLPERLRWMQPAVAEYIEEEIGHDAVDPGRHRLPAAADAGAVRLAPADAGRRK